jgi:ATP/maltotriose-dependent transcriptional regulator MalT
VNVDERAAASALNGPDKLDRPNKSGFDWWARSPQDGGCGLTAQEWQAWLLIACDASPLEIASRLSISVLAARLLVHDVLVKLGVADCSEAVARARELGLVASDDEPGKQDVSARQGSPEKRGSPI